jgi:hypothetical protein
MASGEKMKGPAAAAAAAANLDPNINENTGIHTYEAPWPRESRFRLAVGSFIEDYPNKVTYTHTHTHTPLSSHTYQVSSLSLSLSQNQELVQEELGSLSIRLLWSRRLHSALL